jgi:hypothetical protein
MDFKNCFHDAIGQTWIHHIRPGEFPRFIRAIRFIRYYS